VLNWPFYVVLNVSKAQWNEFCEAENKDCVSGADFVPET
jgi:hypothetical protein